MQNPIDELAHLFMKFPGIGRRQARRFAYFIIQSNPSFSNKLANQIVNMQKQLIPLEALIVILIQII
jgi:recombinational DNA repair protein RecR